MVLACSSALFSKEKFEFFFEIEGERRATKLRDKLGSVVAHRRIGGKYAEVLIFRDVHCENRVIPAAEAGTMTSMRVQDYLKSAMNSYTNDHEYAESANWRPISRRIPFFSCPIFFGKITRSIFSQKSFRLKSYCFRPDSMAHPNHVYFSSEKPCMTAPFFSFCIDNFALSFRHNFDPISEPYGSSNFITYKFAPTQHV